MVWAVPTPDGDSHWPFGHPLPFIRYGDQRLVQDAAPALHTAVSTHPANWVTSAESSLSDRWGLGPPTV